MAIKKNLAMVVAQAVAFGNLFNNGKAIIYEGTRPADPNDTPAGDAIVEIPIPSIAFVDNEDGTISKNGVWSGIADVSDSASFCRVISQDETKWFDVDVDDEAADMIIDSTTIVAGNAITVISLTITIPDGQ